MKTQTNQLVDVIKKDFPFMHSEVEPLIFGLEENETFLDQIMILLGSPKCFDDFVAKVEEINSELAELIKKNGINYRVLGLGQEFCATGVEVNQLIDCDIEEWYMDNSSLRSYINNLKNQNEDQYTQIQEIVANYASDVTQEISDYLENTMDINLNNHEHIDYVCPGNLIPGEITIENVEDSFIFTDKGSLLWRAENETEWEFIHKNKGQLIGKTQITNPELIPDYIENDRVFALS